LSSHTARLPPPNIPRVTVFPILFVRHPLDRLRSAFDFERVQQLETPGSRLARSCDLAGYAKTHLSFRLAQASNFQTARLAAFEPRRSETSLERAIVAIGKLPFIGLVDAFAESMQLLAHTLRPTFPMIQAVVRHANRTSDVSELAERLKEMEQEIGSKLYRALHVANADDMHIYNLIAERYSRNASSQIGRENACQRS
jgi:hypothetical protein